MRVVIPARYGSTRLPSKVLKSLAGKPLLQHVHERAVASGAEAVVIATDDERVAAAASRFGADTMLTSADHQSGTDRVAEVVRERGWTDDVPIVNVQGDAPLIPPGSIQQVAALLQKHDTADLATFDSLLGYGASLVETGGPEPFVQAYSAEWCLLVFDFFPLHVLLSTRSLLAGAGADRNLLPGETRRDREMVSDCRVA